MRELDLNRRQPLLGAIVEIAFEAKSLAFCGLDDPGARASQFGGSRLELRFEASTLSASTTDRPAAWTSSGSVSSAVSCMITATVSLFCVINDDD